MFHVSCFKEMSRKTKIFLVILIVVLGIFLLFFFLAGRAPKVTPKITTTTEAVTEESQTTSAPRRSPEELKTLSAENQVMAVARAFAERYGSFSNQGGFENLLDLEPIVTETFWIELQELHKSGQTDVTKEYYGISTRALNVKLLKIDFNASAKVSAQTQREEARGDATNKRIYYQEVRMDLVYAEGGWRVDYAKWQ